jgi:hypothetical protein
LFSMIVGETTGFEDYGVQPGRLKGRGRTLHRAGAPLYSPPWILGSRRSSRRSRRRRDHSPGRVGCRGDTRAEFPAEALHRAAALGPKRDPGQFGDGTGERASERAGLSGFDRQRRGRPPRPLSAVDCRARR